MSAAPQVAAAREEARRKLHEKIENFEKSEILEFHRTYPFKIPTAIAAAGSGMQCAGRNSLNRYLRATGFSGVEVETAQETAVKFSVMEKRPLVSRSIMKLPVKVPGKEDLEFLMVPILDEDDRLRDFPIKLHEHLLPSADDRVLFPILKVPKSGLVYDLFPFPAEGDCYDEKQTISFSKAKGDPLLPKKQLEQQLSKGIVCVVFVKLNGEERTLRGTTYKDFIPKKLQGKSHFATDESNEGAKSAKKIGEDQVVMFDVDIQSWRSCKYSSILQLKMRLHPYDTSPGGPPNLSEIFGDCNLGSSQGPPGMILSGPAILEMRSKEKQ